MGVAINTQNIFNINFPAVDSSSLTEGFALKGSRVLENSSDLLGITITFNNNGNPSARGFLDYIEIVGKKQLLADGNQFSFRSFEQSNATDIIEFQIANVSNISQVWDVTNHIEPKNITNESTINLSLIHI